MLTSSAKYGVRDHRGGGDPPAREIASWLPGAVARRVLGDGITIRVVQLAASGSR
jgi:chorismate synthase